MGCSVDVILFAVSLRTVNRTGHMLSATSVLRKFHYLKYLLVALWFLFRSTS